MRKTIIIFLAAVLSPALFAQNRSIEKALTLYDRKMYVQAEDILQSLPEYGDDPVADGYAVLCALKLRSDGADILAENYLLRYASSVLCDDICLEQALILFDKAAYQASMEKFLKVKLRNVPRKSRSEVLFKMGYCCHKEGRQAEAEHYFDEVLLLGENDYSAPARYLKGYQLYVQGDCKAALPLFEQAGADERLEKLSNYYIALCQYDARNFDFLLTEGVRYYEQALVPVDRLPHLARLLSEACLDRGDSARARKYFGASDDGSARTRTDYFYAGSLLFLTKEWDGAIDNFKQVTPVRDSLSQIAWYQMGQAYMERKNKLSALESYKNASSFDYDRKMKEDAFFNYAKLAFDVNGDTSVFTDYIRNYSDRVRGEKIYSYMALASLADKNWQAAIDFYDKIDMLSGVDKDNYVHANYIKGAELLAAGSYRRAASCFMAVTYYAPKEDVVNQLARYNLAEAYYRDGQYDKAASIFVELYNGAALYGLPQGEILSYDAAYAMLRKYDYNAAGAWFARYVAENPSGSRVKDAMLRRADCLFMQADYKGAASAYEEVHYKWSDASDIYPYYQGAVCYGLLKNDRRRLELLSLVKDASPTSPWYAEAMFELGKAQHSLKQKKEAAETFNLLAQRVPGSPYADRAVLELGTLKRGEGDVEGALECYKRVVGKNPSGEFAEDALLGIESIYQSLGKPKEYLAYLETIGRGGEMSEADKENMIFTAAERQYLEENYAAALPALEEFATAHPTSANAAIARYYIAGCHLAQADKLKACDAYLRCAEDSLLNAGARREAAINAATLSYALENYDQSCTLWKGIVAADTTLQSRKLAVPGLIRSASAARRHEDVVAAYALLPQEDSLTAAFLPVAQMRQMKALYAASLTALSRRDEALPVLEDLALAPDTAEGAKANFILAQNAFDKGDFEGVRSRVQKFGQSGTDQTYWLARAFVLLGDSYAEQGNMKQARATWESIREGYDGDEKDITEMLSGRLDKVEEGQDSAKENQ